MKIPHELLMLTLRLEVADYCSIDCCGLKGAIAPEIAREITAEITSEIAPETVQQIIKF
ncbi:MAG: hypothetical protein WBA43_12100 [Elainellaceae cyanobacterium]